MLVRAPSSKGVFSVPGCGQSAGAAQTRVQAQSLSARRVAGPGQASLTNAAGAATAAVVISRRRTSRPARLPNLSVAAQAGRGSGGKGSGGTDEEPDWEAEMSIFNQRISRPNQLATLRELEAKTAVGKVLYSKDGLAIVSGLNSDAPLGTKVSFLTGTAGVLLWHRSDNLSFCLVLGDPSTVVEGTPVECKIKGVLQVVDEVKGPITRKDFDVFTVPAGDETFGRVHDHVGRHLHAFDNDSPQQQQPSAVQEAGAASGGSGAKVAAAGGSGRVAPPVTRPLLNAQVEMKNREQINESLLTGVKGLDILTPLGRGASLLVIGPSGAGKTRLGLDAIIAQAAFYGGGGGSGSSAGTAAVAPPGGVVRCVLALAGRPDSEVQAIVSELRSRGALANTAVVTAGEGAPLAHQYAAMCAACSIGERVRDEGGHALVVVDDIRPLSDVWEQLLSGLAGLGPALLREGLVKDDKGRDMPVVAPSASASDGGGAAAPTEAAAAGPAAAAGAAASAASVPAGLPGGDDDTALVEYEGMLVSGAVAQRRGFLSTFFMRAAKMSRTNGGGSMSLVPLVPGTCATGVSKRIDMSKYKTLSPEQLAKLEAALRAKQLAEELASAGSGAGELATEVVEEFISIADGQVVLDRKSGQAAALEASPSYTVNPKLSITRIGTRAYYKAMEALAPQVRLDLAQADDARRFGATASTASGSSVASADLTSTSGAASAPGAAGQAVAALRADALAQRLSAALLQVPGEPVALAEQVVTLYAVLRGWTDAVPPAAMGAWLRGALAHVRSVAPAAMQELGRTGILTAAAEKAISDGLRTFTFRP
ncbi:hypothetical protein HYH02_014166 [Chlamydomonas schloesseri]|uniref:ATPase F1/V1/A1 complex alpha/beta subunit nucleotide-binding domain-containing protein n=1 Tax=Chlamydomonas schloesseri TaxID=2026947 RepID=A0A835SLD3_9CHLO|nr:hypothetical protein HYH02_014166 [Chlamydomonas schloesseri]|eukprot:KAG2429129.1 hypothetical protein HYH02_014166 [Chlamydomonas schloesseri]